MTADALHCTVTPPTAARAVDVCTTTFEGQRLQIAVTYRDHQRDVLNPTACRVTYGAETLACRAGFGYGYGVGTSGTVVTISDTLGASPMRLAQPRETQPLLYLYEDDWIVLTTGMALVAAGLATFVLWRWSRFQIAPLLVLGSRRLLLARAGQVVVCLGSSVLFFGWMWYGLLFMLFGLGLAD